MDGEVNIIFGLGIQWRSFYSFPGLKTAKFPMIQFPFSHMLSSKWIRWIHLTNEK